MKYLRLVDHNGIVTLVQQVFVDGVDFEWTSPEPRAVWLGKIELLDRLPREVEEEILEERDRIWREKTGEEVIESEPETVIQEPQFSPYEPRDKQEEIELQQEAEQHILEDAAREVLESEPETVIQESSGDSGVAPPDASKGVETPPENGDRGDAGKRDKGDRRLKKS